jgi:hypothetical protein
MSGISSSGVGGAANGSDGAWELAMDSGLSAGTFAKAVLGTLNGDLYLFGSALESTGAMKGVWRYRNGSWLQLNALAAQDFNRLAVYGAVEYKNKLYVGDRHSGKLYRLDLHATNLAADGGPAFTALTDLGSNFVGKEDVFPGPVLWGKLYLGTFGFTGGGPISPGLYTYDGTSVVQVADFTGSGVGGQVTSMVPYDGELWVTVINSTATTCEIWAFDQAGNARPVQASGTPVMQLANWNGELVGVVGGSATSKFVVWTGQAFDDLTPTTSLLQFASNPEIYVYGDELWALNGGDGFIKWSWDSFYHDVTWATESIKASDGYIWRVTNQPVQLWRKKIGTDHVARTLGRQQRSSAGARVNLRPRKVAALPTASAVWRGQILRVEGGAGVTDHLYCCIKNAADAYVWTALI